MRTTIAAGGAFLLLSACVTPSQRPTMVESPVPQPTWATGARPTSSSGSTCGVTTPASRPSAQFYAPGPIVEAEITQPSHPVFYGYTAKTLPVRYAGGPLLSIQGLEADRDKQTLMRFRGTDAAVLSGLMKGAAETRNRPAIAEIQSGKGRVLMFATNPCFRYQTLGEFNMLFNAVLHYNDVR